MTAKSQRKNLTKNVSKLLVSGLLTLYYTLADRELSKLRPGS